MIGWMLALALAVTLAVIYRVPWYALVIAALVLVIGAGVVALSRIEVWR